MLFLLSVVIAQSVIFSITLKTVSAKNVQRRKTMKNNWNLIFCFVYVALWVGIALGYYGQHYEAGIFDWTVIPKVLIVFAFPCFFGFEAGKKYMEKK